MQSQEVETDDDVRMFMRQKYYEQKWLDAALLKEHTLQVAEKIKYMFNEEGARRPRVSTPPLPGADKDATSTPADPIQRPFLPPTETRLQPKEKDLLSDIAQPVSLHEAMGAQTPGARSRLSQGNALGDFQGGFQDKRMSLPSPMSNKNSFLSDLAGLDTLQTNKAVYTGGCLVPNTSSSSSPQQQQQPTPPQRQTVMISPTMYSPPVMAKKEPKSDIRSPIRDADPYAALRGLSLHSPSTPSNASNAPKDPYYKQRSPPHSLRDYASSQAPPPRLNDFDVFSSTK